MRRFLTLGAALVLLVSACGADTSESASTTEGTTTTLAPASTSSASTIVTPETPTSTTESRGTSITVAPPTAPMVEADLPGEDFDVTPSPGATLAVVGVAFDDVLNVRRGPGIDFHVVAELGPQSNEFEATGRARLFEGSSIWFEGRTPLGIVGWVNGRYTAQMGSTDDFTSLVVTELGEIPSAQTMADLGLIVAEALASVDPKSEIIMTVEPTVGDLGEVTYDVVGLGDDALWTLRLHVFGQPADGSFSLKSVEATSMCVAVRGVSDGVCV